MAEEQDRQEEDQGPWNQLSHGGQELPEDGPGRGDESVGHEIQRQVGQERSRSHDQDSQRAVHA